MDMPYATKSTTRSAPQGANFTECSDAPEPSSVARNNAKLQDLVERQGKQLAELGQAINDLAQIMHGPGPCAPTDNKDPKPPACGQRNIVNALHTQCERRDCLLNELRSLIG